MEGGIIQNHHLPWTQHGTQLLFKPRLDQFSMAVALEGQRRQHLALTPSRCHRNARGAMPQALTPTAFSFSTPTIGIGEGVFYSRFIHIYLLMSWDGGYDGSEVLSLGFVALTVAPALFLRVHPKRRNHVEKVIWLRRCPVSCSQAACICPRVASR